MEILSCFFVFLNSLFLISSTALIIGASFVMNLVEYNIYILFVLIAGCLMLISSIIGFIFFFKKMSLFFFIIIMIFMTIIELSFALLFSIHKDIDDFVMNNMNKMIEVDEDEKNTIMKVILISLWCSFGCCLFDLICSLIYLKKNNTNILGNIENVQNLVHSGYTQTTTSMS